MSQNLSQSSQQVSSSQNPENKAQQNKQIPPNMHSDGQNNPEPTGQKKQQDNDYQCEFKLVVKEKFQQKLNHDETDCIFTVIINEIIEQRIRKNYSAEDQTIPPLPEPVTYVQDIEQQAEPTKNVPSQLDKLKAEDQKVKKRIKELLKKRPKKKGLTYELDPNRDKGFILAKRMNDIKQEREKKYILSKKQLQVQKNQLIESQMSTIACIQNFSMHLARKGNRRYTKQFDESYRLPMIHQQNNFINETDKFNKSRYGLHDFLGKNKVGLDQTQKMSLSSQKYESLALSSRSNYESVKKDKKRDMLRQIQILKKSQKITEKYQTRKIACDILIDIIFSAVKLVETKKQFYFNAPPKPVHQMLRNYKDKNGKTVWLPGSKPDKFRININLKQSRKEKSQGNKSQVSDNVEEESNGSTVKNFSRISQVNQTIDVMINKKTDKSEGSVEDDETGENEREEMQREVKQGECKEDADNRGGNEQNEQNQSQNVDEQANYNKESKLNDNTDNNEQNPEIPIYL